MQTPTPSHEELAKDFLRLTPDDLKAKYPDDQEVQGALAQITIARKIFEANSSALASSDHVEAEIMRRIALNLAQGLPVVLPDLDSICRHAVGPE